MAEWSTWAPADGYMDEVEGLALVFNRVTQILEESSGHLDRAVVLANDITSESVLAWAVEVSRLHKNMQMASQASAQLARVFDTYVEQVRMIGSRANAVKDGLSGNAYGLVERGLSDYKVLASSELESVIERIKDAVDPPLPIGEPGWLPSPTRLMIDSAVRSLASLALLRQEADEVFCQEAQGVISDTNVLFDGAASGNPFKVIADWLGLNDYVIHQTQRLTGPVSMTMQPEDVRQGAAGDCWYLAALAALANTPGGRATLQQNMIWDPVRQGYWVTLYRNGKPEVYFVDTVYADGAYTYDAKWNRTPSWVSVYEAALVQYYGGDAFALNGGSGNAAFEILTGQDATGLDASQGTWLIRDALADGETVVAASQVKFPWDSEFIEVVAQVQNPNGTYSPRTIEIVRNHEYSVVSVDADGNIYIRNPWGPGNTAGDDGRVIMLTQTQFWYYFHTVSVGSA